jgi:hypothetical protein
MSDYDHMEILMGSRYMRAMSWIDHCLDVLGYGNKTVNMYVMSVKKWAESNRIQLL